MKREFKKKIVFLDMDGVLADFDGSVSVHIQDPPEMFISGFFRNLKVLPGAKEGVQALLNHPKLKVYIGTKHTTKTDYSPSEKVGWVREHFPELLKRMCIVTDKNLLKGDYLIDDDTRWKTFDGEFIHFDKNRPEEEWKRVVDHIEKQLLDYMTPEERSERAYHQTLVMQEMNRKICEIGACIHEEHHKDLK